MTSFASLCDLDINRDGWDAHHSIFDCHSIIDKISSRINDVSSTETDGDHRNRENYHVLKTVKRCSMIYDSIYASHNEGCQHNALIYRDWLEKMHDVVTTTPEQDESCSEISGLLKIAAEVLPDFHDFVVLTCREFADAAVTVAELKAVERIEAKVRTDYEGNMRRVLDVVRASVVFPDLSILNEFLRNFIARYAEASSFDGHEGRKCSIRLRRIKSGFASRYASKSYGYRDVKINIEVNHHICELQLHTEEFFKVKCEAGHKLYKWARNFAFEGITDMWQIFEHQNEGAQLHLASWLCSQIKWQLSLIELQPISMSDSAAQMLYSDVMSLKTVFEFSGTDKGSLIFNLRSISLSVTLLHNPSLFPKSTGRVRIWASSPATNLTN